MVRGKFYVESKTEFEYNWKLTLRAVVKNSPENALFADATPSGVLEIYVKKPVADQFEVKKEYYLDFTDAAQAAEHAPVDWEAKAVAAYYAYGQATEFKNYQGLPMPEWPDLSDTIRSAWIASVKRVANDFNIRWMDNKPVTE